MGVAGSGVAHPHWYVAARRTVRPDFRLDPFDRPTVDAPPPSEAAPFPSTPTSRTERPARQARASRRREENDHA